jgi:hypothetical protein
LYVELALYNKTDTNAGVGFMQRISNIHNRRPVLGLDGNVSVNTTQCCDDELTDIVNSIDTDCITNMKEFRSFSLLTKEMEIPEDIFNIVCNNIIREMENYQKIVFTQFRDTIYDTLIYNLDVAECMWHIITHFIENDSLQGERISNVPIKTHLFFKYFNNNYRPIYHLESMLFYIINQVYGLQ